MRIGKYIKLKRGEFRQSKLRKQGFFKERMERANLPPPDYTLFDIAEIIASMRENAKPMREREKL